LSVEVAVEVAGQVHLQAVEVVVLVGLEQEPANL
jgi:hypothetical protein